MGHGIFNDKMFSVREVPWHKLGIVVDHLLTAEEALETANLTWAVGLSDVFTYVKKTGTPPKQTKVAGAQATVRLDTGEPLAVVGSRYTPLQNNVAFRFFDELTASGEAKYDTAGSLFNGRKIFISANLSDLTTVQVANGEDIKLFLLLSNSHDGTEMVKVTITPVRVVCSNTLRMAMIGYKSQWAIKHTVNMDGKISEARKILGLSVNYMKQFEDVANKLYESQIGKAEFKTLLEDTKFPKRSVDEILNVFDTAPDLREVEGTRWGAYNAVADWYDWGRRPRKVDNWAANVMYGGDIKSVALDALLVGVAD